MDQLVGRLMLDRVDFPAEMQGHRYLSVNQASGRQNEHGDATICENVKTHKTHRYHSPG